MYQSHHRLNDDRRQHPEHGSYDAEGLPPRRLDQKYRPPDPPPEFSYPVPIPARLPRQQP